MLTGSMPGLGGRSRNGDCRLRVRGWRSGGQALGFNSYLPGSREATEECSVHPGWVGKEGHDPSLVEDATDAQHCTDPRSTGRFDLDVHCGVMIPAGPAPTCCGENISGPARQLPRTGRSTASSAPQAGHWITRLGPLSAGTRSQARA